MMPRPVVFASVAFAFAAVACTSTETTTAPTSFEANTAVVTPTIQATARVRCELTLSGPVSKISIRGKNLSPPDGFFRGLVRSGGVRIGTLIQQVDGGEATFLFSSDPADIARGARAIPGDFIKVNPNGPDVLGAILDPNFNRVVVAEVDCVVR